MKKTALWGTLLIAGLSLTSCVKTYTCLCEITWEPGQNDDLVTYEEHQITGTSKKSAKTACDVFASTHTSDQRKSCTLK